MAKNKIVVGKKNKKRSNAAGASKKVSRPSRKNKDKKHQSDLQRLQIYNNKKAEEQQSKDMMARQKALEKMGVPVEQQQFGYEDHREIYNYARRSQSHFVPRVSSFGIFVAPCL